MVRRPPLPPDLRDTAFHVRSAAERGVSPSRLRASDLVRPYRGVRATSAPASLRERCAAYATRMPPEHWFSHATAAQLWDLPLPRRVERDMRLHVSSARREPQATGVRGHRANQRPHVRRHLGFNVLAPADAWCQLGTLLTLDELVAAGERLLGWPRPLCSSEELDAAITRFGSGRGAKKVRAARSRMRAGSASPRRPPPRPAHVAAPSGDGERMGPPYRTRRANRRRLRAHAPAPARYAPACPSSSAHGTLTHA